MQRLIRFMSFFLFIYPVSTEIVIGMHKRDIIHALIQTNRVALINAGTIGNLFQYISDNRHYLLFFDENDTIQYFIVDDIAFSTEENIKVGDTVMHCLQKKGKLMIERGVCFFVQLESGWRAYINDINFDDDYIALSHSPIQFFYKISNAYSDTLSTLSYEEYDKEKSAYQFIDDQKEDIQIIKE